MNNLSLSIFAVMLSSFQVISVIDANTIRIQSDGQSRVIRLIGIEPMTTDSGAATAVLRRSLADRKVFVEFDPAVGPDCAYVYRMPDALFINRQMIAAGYAAVPRDQPFRHRQEFLDAQTAARTAARGLWSGRTFASDWESRFNGVRYLGETHSASSVPAPFQQPAKPRRRLRR